MLSFKKVDEGYLVTEKSFSWTTTKTMTVLYSNDLSKKRIDNDPWIETTAADRAWFEKYYRQKFN